MGCRLNGCVTFKGDASRGYAVTCATFQSEVSQGYASDAGQGLRHHLPPGGGAGDATQPPLAEGGDAASAAPPLDFGIGLSQRTSEIETSREGHGRMPITPAER